MSNQSFKVKSGLTLTPVDLTTLLNPQAGDLACDSNDSNKIKRYDAISSAWTEVGSGGVGSVDIMFVQDFESASLSTFESPTDVVLSTTDPLHGRVSAILTHDASVNKSFKQIIPVDRKFRGQAIVLDLNIKSAASAGNVTIKITDESAPADLIASEQLQLSNDVSGRRSSVSFTIPSTCESLSYTITALPEAGSPVTRIDDIVAMLSDVSLLETSVLVPNLTAWQGYTPTFQGFGTPSNVEFEWRQVGESVEIRGKFTAGVSTAVEARVGLPAGLTSAGTSIIPSLSLAGDAVRTSSATTYFRSNILIEPSVSYVTFGSQTSTTGAITKAVATFVGSSEQISITASIPCAGLSATTTKTIPLTQSGLVQEADSALRAAGNAGQVITAAVTDIPFIATSMIGDAMSWSGSALTVLKAGIFTLDAQLKFTAILERNVNIYVNGTRIGIIGESIASSVHHGSYSSYFNVGDVISFRTAVNGGTLQNIVNEHILAISYAGSLKQVSVSSDQKITIPTSELRFEGASARGTGTETAIVQFTSLAKLRGDAFTIDNSNGTAITMTKAGKLDISAIVTNNNIASSIGISLNQTVRTSAPTITSEYVSEERIASSAGVVSVSGSVFVKVGDIIRVYSTTAIAANTANNLSLSFQEQDIAVSVTNTLPQFSESDSSVRVTVGNGFGSTSTSVRRFANTTQNLGTDITYTDSATAGASFRVNTSGVYNVSYTDTSSSSTPTIEISINGISAAQAVISTASGASTTSISIYMASGDIIRAVTATPASISSNAAAAYFTISKVGKPNVTGVDVTPFVNVEIPSQLNTQGDYIPTATAPGSSDLAASIDSTQAYGSGIYLLQTGQVTVLKDCIMDITYRGPLNQTQYSIDIRVNGTVRSINFGRSGTAGVWSMTANLSSRLKSGDVITFGQTSAALASSLTIAATDLQITTSDTILTAPETFSTDTASLRYANASEYTLSTLQNAPVGTYITFTYAANTNTRTQTTLTNRPTQTDVDMNANGIQIFTRAYNAPSTAAQPAAFAIQIGKGLKGKSLDLYKSAGKVTAGSLDLLQQSATVLLGVSFKEYNEVTGILYIDVGLNNLTSTTASTLFFSDLTTQTSGYLVINASKNPALTGLAIPKTVFAEAANNAAQVVTAVTQDIPFIRVYDTNSAWNGTQFIVPEDGIYQVTVCISTVAANSNRLILYRNGVATGGMSSGITTAQHSGTASIRCVAGDSLSVRVSSTSITLATGAEPNRITITKIAKYI